MSFTYDGKSHLPTLVGLPEGVIAHWSIEGGTNAGEYTVKVTFSVPEGYNPISDLTGTFMINPAVIKPGQVYDSETGEIVSVFTGIVDGDVQDVTSTVVNGEAQPDSTAPVDVSKPGSYIVSTTVKIDEDKLGNYVVDDGVSDTKTTLINVKNENAWFMTQNSATISEDGTIRMDIRIEDAKTPQVGVTGANSTIKMKIEYDRDRLEFVNDGDHTTKWVYTYHDDTGVLEGGYTHSFPFTEDTNLATIYFKLKPGANPDDLIITIRDTQMKVNTGPDFTYTSADTSILLNPSGDIEVIETTVSGDPMDDVIYNKQDELDEAVNKKQEELDKLKDLIDQAFPGTSEETVSDDDPVADEQTTPVTDTNAPSENEQPSVDNSTLIEQPVDDTVVTTEPSTSENEDNQGATSDDVVDADSSNLDNEVDETTTADTDTEVDANDRVISNVTEVTNPGNSSDASEEAPAATTDSTNQDNSSSDDSTSESNAPAPELTGSTESASTSVSTETASPSASESSSDNASETTTDGLAA